MVYCNGCSVLFKGLSEGMCGKCVALPPIQQQLWPQCKTCGSTYQFLANREDCYRCEEAQSSEHTPSLSPPMTDTSFAMSHPVNPRTHSRSNIYINPLTSRSRTSAPLENDQALRDRAKEIHASMGQGYSAALTHAQRVGGRVANPKMAGISSSSVGRAVKAINVKLGQISNRNSHRANAKVLGHIPRMFSYSASVLWSDVLEEIRIELDQLYTETYGHRITSLTDFSLSYTHSQCLLDPDHTTSTIGYLWDMSVKNGPTLHIQPKQLTNITLDLRANVAYPRVSLENDFTDTNRNMSSIHQATQKYVTKRSRTMSQVPETEFKRPSKRIAPVAGAHHYSTTIQISEKVYRVKKTSCEFLPGEGIKWTETSGETIITVDTEHFAHGQTKNVYKLSIGMHKYAAKEFYGIGDEEDSALVTQTINGRYLKAELVCQALAKYCINKFVTEAQAKSLNIFDIDAAFTFMLTVIDGLEKNRSWIVDPLLDNSDIIKFSGTEKAGDNRSSMAGRTCDALAHFSLHDSAGSLVLVDIQGIIHNKTFNGKTTRAKILTLFDVMVHSIDQDKGPGDRGKEGIEDFKKQHHCNDICKVLNLSAFEDVDDNGDELDIYDSTKNKTPPSSDKQLVELYTSNFTPEDV